MADEGESVIVKIVEAAPPAPGETEQSRQRAIRNLLAIAQRLTGFVVPLAGCGDAAARKIAGELGGMSAWVEAFTCVLAGVPLQLTPAPLGELLLASVEVEPSSALDVAATATLVGEGVRGRSEAAASRQAALALSLMRLAHNLLERADAAAAPEGEVAGRHREAERRLMRRMRDAEHAYFEVDLDPDSSVPELSAHGMPREDD